MEDVTYVECDAEVVEIDEVELRGDQLNDNYVGEDENADQ